MWRIPLAALALCACTPSTPDRDRDRPIALPPPHAGLSPGYDLGAGPNASQCLWALTEPMGITAEDLDGDGDVDLLHPRCDRLVLHENDGSGGFLAPRERVFGDWANTVVTADLVGDTLPDLVWAGSDGVRILRNDGDWSFTEVDLGIDYCATCETPDDAAVGLFIGHVLPMDLDRDGDLDLFIGGSSYGGVFMDEGVAPYALPNELWLREGEGFVRDRSFPSTRGTTLHTLVDFEPDGVVLYVLNDFSMPFHDKPELDQLGSCTRIRGTVGDWEEVSFRDLGLDNDSPMGGLRTDLDGDGVADLITSHVGGLVLYGGTGDGLVDMGAAWGVPREGLATTWSIVGIDPDRDGRDDLFVSTGNLPDSIMAPEIRRLPQDDLVLRFAHGGFAPVEGLLPGGRPRAGRGTVLADLSGDGRADLVVQQTPLEAGLPSEDPVGTVLYRERQAGGGVVELRFAPGCDWLGSRITVDGREAGRHLPHQHQGSFGNGPTDRRSIGIGGAAEVEVSVEPLVGPGWSGRVTANTATSIPCPSGRWSGRSSG